MIGTASSRLPALLARCRAGLSRAMPGPTTASGSPAGAAAGSPRPVSCGVMWVTPDSGSTSCGRPAASRAEDSRREWATTTLSSARPWTIIIGRCGSAGVDQTRRRRSASCARYDLRLLVRVAEVALLVVGVVQPQVGDRGARPRPRGRRPGGAAPRAPPDSRRRTSRGSRPGPGPAGSRRRAPGARRPGPPGRPPRGRRWTAFSQAGERPGVPRPSATTTANPWSANHCEVRCGLCAATTRWPCGPPYGIQQHRKRGRHRRSPWGAARRTGCAVRPPR